MLKSVTNESFLPRSKSAAPSKPQTKDGLPPQQSKLRRLGKRPEMMHYNRLIALVLAVNIVYLGITTQGSWLPGDLGLQTLSNLVIVNISMAILIRQQVVINLLFKIATSAPTSWPLSIRWILGKVYHFGGIHVGGAIMGTIWFAGFAAALIVARLNGLPGVSWATVAVTIAILAILIMMIGFATPKFRAKYHDYFERSHRFGGWAALILFWTQTLLFTNDQRGDMAFGPALLSSLGFWLLLLVTLSIALPWLRLKKVPVKIDSPSSHVALTHFNYGVTPFAGSSTAVSRSPLMEWHSFANVPAPGQEGFRLTISRAGDWTGDLIDDKPSHVWVKGIPTAGVGNIDKLFKRVVWVATGSGIGPCLPHLLSGDTPARLVWSTRTPHLTYGDKLVDEILSVQPDAMIWDTNENGRPDLIELAYKAYQEFDAEAVIVISNKKLTWQVVYGMESRGIPAYGAIWDS
jgi:hypothetical protein